jgi:hypothetical protein
LSGRGKSDEAFAGSWASSPPVGSDSAAREALVMAVQATNADRSEPILITIRYLRIYCVAATANDNAQACV